MLGAGVGTATVGVKSGNGIAGRLGELDERRAALDRHERLGGEFTVSGTDFTDTYQNE